MATAKKPAPKMTEAKDKKSDKAAGIKEGSKADMKKDKAMGFKDAPKAASKKRC